MRRQSLVVAVVLGFSVLVGVAQTTRGVTADVPFKFNAVGQSFAAGSYTFTPDNSGTSLTIRNAQSGESRIVLVTTRLAQRTVKTPELVFDRVGEDRYLSEIHLPGTDGYLFQGAPAQHAHATVEAKK